MGCILKCTNLHKSYGGFPALTNVNLTLERGKIVGLLGPNGSGKTTLIKTINGLLAPDVGNIAIDGKPVGVKTKKIVSYLPDTVFLDAQKTVKQCINFHKDFFEDFRVPLAETLLREQNIPLHVKIKALSKGNKEKVCLILAMSRNAQLYILDEPIAGVDVITRDQIISTIINYHSPESTVLISTHLISSIEPILDQVVLIKNGTIVLNESVKQIHDERNTNLEDLYREVFK